MCSTAPRHFTAAEVQLLQTAADQMAVDGDRTRLYTAEQQAGEARDWAQVALAQAQLSERRYRCLVEANIIGIAISDGERVLEANDTFLRLLGYTG
jgi:PAS domain-containing protein